MNSDGTHLGSFLEEARFSWVCGLKGLWISSGSSGDSKGFGYPCEDERGGLPVPCGWSDVYVMD
ncbi:unnamed protein product [Gulo gulo]|uniref:Uncharacterized protein n=1 Tax=Gulo gulo TaxID=48420 RepID=A0A9X9PY51_GULGU|nr:unnamed protein product [Gulo gulo]